MEGWDLEEFEVKSRIESDHMPLVSVWTSKEGLKGEWRKEERRQAERIIQCWDEESTRIFTGRTEEISLSEGGLLEKWEELRGKVSKAVVEKKVRWRKRQLGYKKWWDRECTRKKRKAERKLKRWRKGGGSKEAALQVKRELAELCEKKREEWSKREIEKLNEIRTETEVWKYISKERKVKDKVSEEISMEGWRQHFMGVLEGTDERILGEKRRGGDDEEDLTDEEIEKQIRRLRREKAAGPDGIRSEAWKFCRGQVREKLKEVIKGVWRGEGWPDSWKEEVAGLPEYLRRKGESGSHKRKARARCGNEELGNKYWLREEERNCNIRGREEGTLEHLMERCVWKSTSRVVLDDIIGEKETEGGYRWLKEWEDKRKEESRNRRVAQSQVGQGV
ncbi:Uncharacterized protein DBV15_12707, partial [Temnothorax longispinosus]